MWKFLIFGGALVATCFAQHSPSAIEFANMREDVRGLVQRVGELTLRLEQLERENAALRARAGAADKSYVTVTQLHDAIADVNRSIQSAVSTAKGETLHEVAGQMEKLAKQTNAALDSLARAQTVRPVVPTTFAEDYPKHGVSYTVLRGDTIAEIARKTGAKQADIVNANKITDPSRIVAGQVLFIPGGK